MSVFNLLDSFTVLSISMSCLISTLYETKSTEPNGFHNFFIQALYTITVCGLCGLSLILTITMAVVIILQVFGRLW